MSEHIGFNDERALERGGKLTPEQKKHLKQCLSCKMRVQPNTQRRASSFESELSRWKRFTNWLKSILGKAKSP